MPTFNDQPSLIDLTDPAYSDEPFEYVYYEYYYDYEYDDDIDGSINEEIPSEVPQQHQPLELPQLKEQLLQQQHLTRPITSQQTHLQDDSFIPRGRDPGPSPERPKSFSKSIKPELPQTTFRSLVEKNTINLDVIEDQTERVQPRPLSRDPPSSPRKQPGSRHPPTPPKPQPPAGFDDGRFPHFQNFKPIDINLDPPVPILPPPPRRGPGLVQEQPRSQDIERERQIQKQKEIEKQKQKERQALLEKQKKEMEEEEKRQREIERQRQLKLEK